MSLSGQLKWNFRHTMWYSSWDWKTLKMLKATSNPLIQLMFTGTINGRTNFFDWNNVSQSCFLPDKQLQSWAKVVGTLMQYNELSVILQLKLEKCTAILWKRVVVPLPPPTQCNVENQKKIAGPSFEHCLWGGGQGRAVTLLVRHVCKSTKRANLSQDFCAWL